MKTLFTILFTLFLIFRISAAGKLYSNKKAAMLKKYKLSSVRKEYVKEGSGKLYAVEINTFRDKTRIQKYLIKDSDMDGIYDFELICLYANGSPAVIIIKDEKRILGEKLSISTYSSRGIDVGITSNDGNGTIDKVILMTKNKILESFILNKKTGKLMPFSAEEYYELQKSAEQIAPFINATTNAIQSVKNN